MSRNIIDILQEPLTRARNAFRERSSQPVELSASAIRAENQRLLIKAGQLHHFEPNTEAVQTALEHFAFSDRLLKETDANNWFNTDGGHYVSTILGQPVRGIKIHAMVHRHGLDIVEGIVDAWVGNLDVIQTVQVGSHETTFHDGEGNIRVCFFGTGRKMDGNSHFRAHNAVQVLDLLGIQIPVKEIIQPDMQHFYRPLEFNRQVDGWRHHELDEVRG